MDKNLTVDQILNDPHFSNSAISNSVFGSPRMITDKSHNLRGYKWLPGDKDLIADFLKKSYNIICIRQ